MPNPRVMGKCGHSTKPYCLNDEGQCPDCDSAAKSAAENSPAPAPIDE